MTHSDSSALVSCRGDGWVGVSDTEGLSCATCRLATGPTVLSYEPSPRLPCWNRPSQQFCKETCVPSHKRLPIAGMGFPAPPRLVPLLSTLRLLKCVATSCPLGHLSPQLQNFFLPFSSSVTSHLSRLSSRASCVPRPLASAMPFFLLHCFRGLGQHLTSSEVSCAYGWPS